MKLKIQVILGSTRQQRFGDKPAKWIFESLQKVEGIEPELLDLREYPLPFFDEPVSPSYKKEDYTHPVVAKWTKKIGEADGYIFVTPEYNHSFSAVLKNAIDYVSPEWNKKPVAFVGYGSLGGVRAIEQLRQVIAELQMVGIRNAVYITEFWNFIDENGKLKTEKFEQSKEAMITQLIWYATLLKKGREQK